MKIAIYGAGAIGGLVAARFAHHGADVVLVCRTAEQADAIGRDGLRLITPRATTVVPIVATTAPAAAVDIAFLAIKAYALRALLDAGTLDNARTVVPLLHGREHPAVLRQALPTAVGVRVAAIYAQASRTGVDTVEQQSMSARIALSSLSGVGDDPLRTALTVAGFATDVAREAQVVWDKFTRVCWAATLCSVPGTILGRARTTLQGQADALAAELDNVATADGVAMDGAQLRAQLWSLPATLEPSLLRDVQAGGHSETEAITGAPNSPSRVPGRSRSRCRAPIRLLAPAEPSSRAAAIDVSVPDRSVRQERSDRGSTNLHRTSARRDVHRSDGSGSQGRGDRVRRLLPLRPLPVDGRRRGAPPRVDRRLDNASRPGPRHYDDHPGQLPW